MMHTVHAMVGLAAFLSVGLFLPIMLGMEGMLEDRLIDCSLAETVEHASLQSLQVACIAVLIPSLIEITLALFIYSRMTSELMLRLYSMIGAAACLLIEISAAYHPNPITLTCCAHICLYWVLLSSSFIHSLMSLRFDPRLAAAVLLVYVYLLVDLFSPLLPRSQASTATTTLKFIAVVSVFGAYLHIIYGVVLSWISSGKSLKLWFAGLDGAQRGGILGTVGTFGSLLTVFVLSYVICGSGGVKDSSEIFLETVFAMIFLSYSLSIAMRYFELTRRFVNVSSDLETKRHFIRYMSHELRYIYVRLFLFIRLKFYLELPFQFFITD